MFALGRRARCTGAWWRREGWCATPSGYRTCAGPLPRVSRQDRVASHEGAVGRSVVAVVGGGCATAPPVVSCRDPLGRDAHRTPRVVYEPVVTAAAQDAAAQIDGHGVPAAPTPIVQRESVARGPHNIAVLHEECRAAAATCDALQVQRDATAAPGNMSEPAGMCTRIEETVG